jgi:hypothetical protein
MPSNYENAAAVNTHSGQFLPGTLSGGEALSPSATLDPGGGVISTAAQRAARNGGQGKESAPLPTAGAPSARLTAASPRVR